MYLAEQIARDNCPLSHAEKNTAQAVFDEYNGLDREKAWQGLRARALETDRPFHAYTCAHAVACDLVSCHAEEAWSDEDFPF